MALEGLGLGDFTRNREFGRAKLLMSLKENDHEWVHLLLFEADKKDIAWMREDYYGQQVWSVGAMMSGKRSEPLRRS